MLKFLKKDQKKVLNKKYSLLLEKAMNAQRSGDIKEYSMLTAEAEKILTKLDRMK